MLRDLFILASLLIATGANPIATAAAPKPVKSDCTDLQLVIARGTTEPGTFGQVVGDPLYAATVAKVDKKTTVSGYAVNYPASFACNSESIGVADTVNHVLSQAAQCPKQVFALVGYSQGADLMHNATIALNANPSICSKVIALTMFGDPGNRGPYLPSPLGGITFPFPAQYANKLKENCAYGDPICSFSGTNVTAHLSYSSPGTNFIADSANYIVNQYQTHGNSGPEPAAFGRPGADPATSPTPGNIAAQAALGQLLGAPATPCPA